MPKRVLLVEDNAAIRRTLAAHLTAGGYAVTESVNTDAAYVAYRATRPDVVLLDADLARGNAFDLVGKLRNEPNGHETPLVLISRPDRDDMSLLMQALDANAVQAVLHKPGSLTAEEFRQIGDLEGARDLLEEVIAHADGALKNKAQGMLASLS